MRKHTRANLTLTLSFLSRISGVPYYILSRLWHLFKEILPVGKLKNQKTVSKPSAEVESRALSSGLSV